MMKTLTPDAFFEALEGGQVDSLYLFTGPLAQEKRRATKTTPEAYLQRQAVRALIDHVLDGGDKAFDLSTFSLTETPLAKIVDAARQLPVFSQRRIVLVRDVDAAFKTRAASESGGSQPRSDSPGSQELIQYLKNPSETTTVVFFYDKPDRRLNLATALLKTCTVVQFRPLNETQAKAWSQNYLGQHSCRIDDAAMGLLIGRTGLELTRLINELNKLITYVGQGPISRADVAALVPHLREHSNFELTDHLLARNLHQALKLLNRQIEAGQQPVMLLGLMANLYRRMMMAKDLMAQGAPNNEVAKAVGMSPHAVGRFNAQVRRIPIDHIQYGIKRIAEVDRAIKSSLGPPGLQLEFLVWELCHDSAQTPL